MFAQPENEWESEKEKEREREGRWYKGSYSPCAFHEILSRMGSVERKILKSIPGVWGRSLTPARMRTNSNCMAMMLIWVSHSVWNGNRESRAELAEEDEWIDMHMWIWGLQTSKSQIMGSWACRLLRLGVAIWTVVLAHVLGKKLHNLSRLCWFVQCWNKYLMTLINKKSSSPFLGRAGLTVSMLKRLVRAGLVLV